jgi:hypothetical protein
MRNSDLTSDTVEVFSWLESDLGYAKKVSRFFDYNIAKKITYNKENITIFLVCDNRENMLYYEIFASIQGHNICIKEPKSPWESSESSLFSEGYQNVEYESIFDYTKDVFDRKQFQQLRNEAELQKKKRGGRKKYIEVFSQLIKVALPAIEAATNPPTT